MYISIDLVPLKKMITIASKQQIDIRFIPKKNNAIAREISLYLLSFWSVLVVF